MSHVTCWKSHGCIFFIVHLTTNTIWTFSIIVQKSIPSIKLLGERSPQDFISMAIGACTKKTLQIPFYGIRGNLRINFLWFWFCLCKGKIVSWITICNFSLYFTIKMPIMQHSLNFLFFRINGICKVFFILGPCPHAFKVRITFSWPLDLAR